MHTDAIQTDPRLATDLCGLKLRTPVLTASGTCGYGPEYQGLLDYHRLGGLTTKSVTRHERPGNPPERIVEVRAGILNAIGLANVGIERFVSEKIPFIREMPTQVFANVAGYSAQDYVLVAERLDQHACIAAIELNVSCPNVADGLQFGTDPKRLCELVQHVRRVVKRAKLIVKLSPNVTDIAEMARAAIDGGTDMLSLVNTFVGMSIDVDTWKPKLANGTGGLSGPAIKPLAVNLVQRVYRDAARVHNVPIIGMGGIQTWQDAVEFFLAGASAVSVGTALFIDPAAPIEIADGLKAYLSRKNLSNIRELVGKLTLPGDVSAGAPG